MMQEANTKTVIDGYAMIQHTNSMLSKAEIIDAIRRLQDEGITQREMAEVMGVAAPRISELLSNPKKRLTVEEAKRLVDHYDIGESVTFSSGALKAILRGLIEERVAPQVSEQDLVELAGALQHLLRRLSTHPRLADNPDALMEAARAAVARRDLNRRG